MRRVLDLSDVREESCSLWHPSDLMFHSLLCTTSYESVIVVPLMICINSIDAVFEAERKIARLEAHSADVIQLLFLEQALTCLAAVEPLTDSESEHMAVVRRDRAALHEACQAQRQLVEEKMREEANEALAVQTREQARFAATQVPSFPAQSSTHFDGDDDTGGHQSYNVNGMPMVGDTGWDVTGHAYGTDSFGGGGFGTGFDD